MKLLTTTLSISWKSVTEPVDPTQPNASCFGNPLAVTQLDGYSPDGTTGSAPTRLLAVPPTGVNVTS